MHCNAIFYPKPAGVKENLQQFHMHSKSLLMCKTCARPCDQLFSEISQKCTASMQTLEVNSPKSRKQRLRPGFPVFAWPVVPTLINPAPYCSAQACLLQRGCGWLLHKHKSSWEIKISLTRSESLQSARLGRRNYAASDRKSKRFAVAI